MKRILFALLALSLIQCSSPKSSAPGIDLQAHRGGAGLMPENTFTSMKNALDMRINTLEMDLQITSDGKVVVSHDNYFHPRCAIRPDGTPVQQGEPKEYIHTMPYDSAAKYEVGLKPTDKWPEKALISEHVPLASELLDFTEQYAKDNGIPLPGYNIEIKSRTGEGEGTLWPDYVEFCDTCIPLLLSKNLGERLIVQTFDPRSMEYIHEKWPEVILSYLTEKDPDIEAILATISFQPQWWSPNYAAITPENVAFCHKRGIKVVPWTVDEPEDIRRMADCGVDAIISNYPDRLIEILRK